MKKWIPSVGVVALGAAVLVALLLIGRSDDLDARWPEIEGFAVVSSETTEPQSGLPTKIRRLVDGSTMVLVPGGTFQMGAAPTDDEAWPDEKPRQRITLSPYFMDVHEVTYAQFRAFVAATSYQTEALEVDKGLGLAPEGNTERLVMISGLTWSDCNPCRAGSQDRHPVACVTWRDAVAYCEWVGASLPTEHELEFLLRLDSGAAKYPWGESDVPPQSFANVLDVTPQRAFPLAKTPPLAEYDDGFIGTAPVMSFSANSIGIYDLCGNVSEWCAGVFMVPYQATDLGLSPDSDEGVVRGGSWASSREWLRSSMRQGVNRRLVRGYVGFRCAWRLRTQQGGE